MQRQKSRFRKIKCCMTEKERGGELDRRLSNFKVVIDEKIQISIKCGVRIM